MVNDEQGCGKKCATIHGTRLFGIAHGYLIVQIISYPDAKLGFGLTVQAVGLMRYVQTARQWGVQVKISPLCVQEGHLPRDHQCQKPGVG